MNKDMLWRDALRKKISDEISLGNDIWSSGGKKEMPFNPRTGQRYTSTNALYLRNTEYEDPRWLTFDDVKEFDATIKEGSKGKVVQRWVFDEQRNRKDRDGNDILNNDGTPVVDTVPLDKPRLSNVLVFNAEQIEGLPQDTPRQRDEDAEKKVFDYYDSVENANGLSPLQRDDFEDNRTFLGEVLRRAVQSMEPSGSVFVAGTLSHAQAVMENNMTINLLCDEFGVEPPSLEVPSVVREKWITLIDKDPFYLYRLSTSAEDRSRKLARNIRGLDHELEKTAPNNRGDELKINRNESERGLGAEPSKVVNKSISSDLKNGTIEVEGNGKTKEKTAEIHKVPVEVSKSEEVKVDANKYPEEEKREAHPEVPNKEVFDRRTYIYVPYEHRHEAKRAGAMWDQERKSWYATRGTYRAGLEKWVSVTPVVPEKKSLTEVLSEFAQALESAGLIVPSGGPVMDGKIHRVPVVGGKSNARDGAYSGYLDGIPAGYIENYKTGVKTKWKSSSLDLTQEEIQKLKAQSAQKAHDRMLEIRNRYEETSKKAEYLFNRGSLDAASCPYIIKKCIVAVGVRRSSDGGVLVPLRDMSGKIWSIQTITNEQKSFLKGGKVEGNYHVLGSDDDIKKQQSLIFAESYSTAASIHEATGKAVICAFNAGNLVPVAKQFKEQYPEKGFVIAGDDDRHLPLQTPPLANTGAEKAALAAEEVGGSYVLPVFANETPDRTRTDFNDLSREHGLKAVKSQITKGLLLEAKKKEQTKARKPEVTKKREAPTVSRQVTMQRPSNEAAMGIER